MLVPERVLPSGKVVPAFRIDDDLAPRILRRSWHTDKDGYLTASLKWRGKYKSLSLARYVFTLRHGHKPNHQVDHINRDKLDNRSENLRDLTLQENIENGGGRPRTVLTLPKYVYLRSGNCKSKPYMATVRFNGKSKFLGYHSSIELAVAARDAFLISINRRIPDDTG